MSFFTNRTERRPGPITGNAVNGLCEKVCIQTKKVFDSCMKQTQESDLLLTLTSQSPANPTEPLTFVSASSSIYNPATVTNLVVERFDDKPNFARVQCTVNIPVIVEYTDANNIPGTGEGIVSVDQDVILYVPQASIIPFQIEAFGGCSVPDGTYIGDSVFQIDACLTVILKVTVEAELLIPSYGYCMIPPCQEYTQEACNGFFDLPLYPVPNR